MGKKWKFLAFIKTAGVLGGGSVTLAILSFGITAFEHARDHNVAAWTFGALTILFFCAGAFSAWNMEHERAESLYQSHLDERPCFALDIKGEPGYEKGRKKWETVARARKSPANFSLRHLSGRMANSIRFDPVQSKDGKFSLRFADIPYLTSSKPEPMNYEVWEGDRPQDRATIESIGWGEMLRQFIGDPTETAEYLLTVHFVDGVEQRTHSFRLVFDCEKWAFSANSIR